MLTARIALFCLFALAVAPSAQAEICAKDHHSVEYGTKTANLQDYNCVIGSSAAGLRVTFYRVSEIVAGALIKGVSLPAIDRIIGPITFVNNDVYNETKELFSKFGNSVVYETADDINWSVTIAGETEAAPPKVQATPAATPTATSMKAYYLTGLYTSIASDGILLKSPSEEILNTAHFPNGYSMTYTCEPDASAFVTCTTLWRYVGASEFDGILTDVDDAYRRVERELGATNGDNADRLMQLRSGTSDIKRYFALLRYLDQRSLPPKFLYISNSPLGGNVCDPKNWIFAFGGRPLQLDLAVIENRSGKPANITDFVGNKRTDESFRLASELSTSATNPSGSLGLPVTVLSPGAKIAVALRIAFTEEPMQDTDANAAADATYAKIHSKPRNTIFKDLLGGFNSRKAVTKTWDSFQSPSIPEAADYAYGPQIALHGLTVDKSNYVLQGLAPNSVATDNFLPNDALDFNINKIVIWKAPPGACCPVLYAWNEESREWVYSRKVLHLANGREWQATDRVAFDLLKTCFRIVEREPEASFVDRVKLILTLRDGRNVQLDPRQAMVPFILANSAFEIHFDLPVAISPREVVKSEFELSGYYRRYSDVLAAQNGSPPATSPSTRSSN